MRGLIFLVIGGPAAGKSTTCRAIADRLSPSIHIAVDDLRLMVRGGLALPSADWSEPLRTQVRLARETATAMAIRYAEAGFAVVIDDFWDPDDPAPYRALRDRLGVRPILLAPTEDAARQRLAERSGGADASYIGEAISLLYPVLAVAAERARGDGWHVIDTSGLGVQEVVDEILGEAAIDRAAPRDR